jgi:hypothetical protein
MWVRRGGNQGCRTLQGMLLNALRRDSREVEPPARKPADFILGPSAAWQEEWWPCCGSSALGCAAQADAWWAAAAALGFATARCGNFGMGCGWWRRPYTGPVGRLRRGPSMNWSRAGLSGWPTCGDRQGCMLICERSTCGGVYVELVGAQRMSNIYILYIYIYCSFLSSLPFFATEISTPKDATKIYWCSNNTSVLAMRKAHKQ